MKILLIGTAWPYRGGLAAFNERLIRAFREQGHEASIETFTLQYPGILFPGKTQYSNSAAPEIPIVRTVHALNPFNWLIVGNRLRRERYDLVIIKYWTPFLAPCFGTIARRIRKNGHTKCVCIADNIVPHEPRWFDKPLTRYFIGGMDAFVVMSNSVMQDLAQFDRKKFRALNPHPLFDNFGASCDKATACAKLHLDPAKRYLLFFGFIRDYKGLDLLLQAMAQVRSDVSLIVAGEFYTSSAPYLEMIASLQLKDRVFLFNHFIADEDVRYYFGAADLVVQPYKHATQSGVTQIAYHFEVPMIVTRTGGLSEMVPDGQVGYVTDATPAAIATAIDTFYTEDKAAYFRTQLQEEKKRFTWERMVQTITDLYRRIR